MRWIILTKHTFAFLFDHVPGLTGYFEITLAGYFETTYVFFVTNVVKHGVCWWSGTLSYQVFGPT